MLREEIDEEMKVLKEEFGELTWAYTIPDTSPHFITESAYRQSAMYKIITGTLYDPLASSGDEENHVNITTKTAAKNPQKNTKTMKANKTAKAAITTKANPKTIEANSNIVKADSKPNNRDIPTEPPVPKKNQHIYGFIELKPSAQKSSLNKYEHSLGTRVLRHLNAQIISIPPIKLLQEELNEYQCIMNKIREERQQFLQYVKSEWENSLVSRIPLENPTLESFVDSMWKEKKKSVKNYSQFYKMIGTLPLVYVNTNNPIEMNLLQELETAPMNGRFPIFHNSPVKLDLELEWLQFFNDVYKEHRGKKCLISKDINAEKLAKAHKADIVISLSSLKRLSNTNPPYDVSWDLPITIQNYKLEENKRSTKVHTIVYIDQPLAPLKSNTLQKTEWFYKTALKLRLLKNHYSTKKQKMQRKSQNEAKKVDKDDDESYSDDDDKLIIDIDESLLNEDSTSKPQTSTSEDIPSDNTKGEKNKYDYRLWKIKQSLEEKLSKNPVKPLTVLVRSRSEAKIINNKVELEATFMAKLECQPEYGSEALTSSEAAISWTNLFFRPNSQLFRVRLYPNTGETVMYEKLPLSLLNQEIQKFCEWKSQNGLGCYFNIFNILAKYPPGQYLLRHDPKHRSFAILFEATEEKNETSLDLHQEYNVDYNDTIVSQNIPWHRLDPDLISPNFYFQEIMPCMFNVPCGKSSNKKSTTKRIAIRNTKRMGTKGQKRKKMNN